MSRNQIIAILCVLLLLACGFIVGRLSISSPSVGTTQVPEIGKPVGQAPGGLEGNRGRGAVVVDGDGDKIAHIAGSLSSFWSKSGFLRFWIEHHDKTAALWIQGIDGSRASLRSEQVRVYDGEDYSRVSIRLFASEEVVVADLRYDLLEGVRLEFRRARSPVNLRMAVTADESLVELCDTRGRSRIQLTLSDERGGALKFFDADGRLTREIGE